MALVVRLALGTSATVVPAVSGLLAADQVAAVAHAGVVATTAGQAAASTVARHSSYPVRHVRLAAYEAQGLARPHTFSPDATVSAPKASRTDEGLATKVVSAATNDARDAFVAEQAPEQLEGIGTCPLAPAANSMHCAGCASASVPSPSCLLRRARST